MKILIQGLRELQAHSDERLDAFVYWPLTDDEIAALLSMKLSTVRVLIRIGAIETGVHFEFRPETPLSRPNIFDVLRYALPFLSVQEQSLGLDLLEFNR